MKDVMGILHAFRSRLAGLGIFEYAPCGHRHPGMEELIRFGLAM